MRSLGLVYIIIHFQMSTLGYLPKSTWLGNGRAALSAITQLYHEEMVAHTPRGQRTGGTQVEVTQGS